MRKKIIILFLLIHIVVSGQKAKNPFQRVSIPDSIALSLENAYHTKNVNAGKNVFNLINRKEFKFVNGVFSFQGQGPHFPRRIFIFYKNKVFIFKSKGAFDSLGVLQEFIDCVKLLEITERDRIKYLKIICKYLQEELGQTYGADITNK